MPSHYHTLSLFPLKGRTQNLLFYVCNHVLWHLFEERGRITHWSVQYFARAFQGMESFQYEIIRYKLALMMLRTGRLF